MLHEWELQIKAVPFHFADEEKADKSGYFMKGGGPGEYKCSLGPSLCGIIKIPVVVEGLQGTDIAYAGISFGGMRA